MARIKQSKESVNRSAVFNKNHPPRVLIISHNHPSFFPGGAEIFAYDLFQQMKRDGEVIPFFLAATNRLSREQHVGTSFLSVNGKKDEFLLHNDAYDFFMQSHLLAGEMKQEFVHFLREIQPDIVHFHHTLRLGFEVIAMVRQALPRAKIFYTLHDYLPICHHNGQMVKTKDYALCESASPDKCHGWFPEITPVQFSTRSHFIHSHFDRVDAFIAPSEFLADRYRAWGLVPKKIHLLRNATSYKPLAEEPPRKDALRNRFTFIGQISPYKGTLLLAEATKLLRERGITDFTVAIHGNISLQTEEYKERFEQEIAALSPQVRCYDRYEKDALPLILSNTDWVVVPSVWWENAPLVITEAFQHKRPVICSNIGGMAELVKHRVNGLNFYAGSAQSLADSMATAMSEKGLWQKLSSAISPQRDMALCAYDHYLLYQKIPSRSDPSLLGSSAPKSEPISEPEWSEL